ncbi:MAG: FAD-binding protein [Legionella sp.]|nr:FAD-binding protein [Legionella sp.]
MPAAQSSHLNNQWDTSKVNQFEIQSGQALLRDEQRLALFSHDFGHLLHSTPAAVYAPTQIDDLMTLISFALENNLPLTIRGKGLSQCGQSLPVVGGLSVSMEHFTSLGEIANNAIWVEANATWADILECSLQHKQAPYVLPYNCGLSVAGLLSVGGVGASSFKYGTVSAHVEALEVINGLGNKEIVDDTSTLFHACLSGQGLFGVITKAKIKLRPVKSHVKTFSLVYTSIDQWFEDLEYIKNKADYLELFCSPCILGATLIKNERLPLVQWLYAMHVSMEYEEQAPTAAEVIGQLKPCNILSSHEEPIASYMLRHQSRINQMKSSGQWDLIHPWYECFVSTQILKEHLPQILKELPVHYANLVHVVPISKQKAGFLQLPKSESFCSLMILNPGLPVEQKDACIHAIKRLDSFFLPLGSKRYLSGYMVDKNWVKHFGQEYGHWIKMKKKWDPKGIFNSMCYAFTTFKEP